MKEGEISREVVVIGGNARIDGLVEGDVVVVGGRADVNGTIDGQLVVVMGDANIGPNALIDDEAVIVGGRLNLDPKSKVDKGKIEVVSGRMLPTLTWMRDWFTAGLLLGRPLPPGMGLGWIVALTILGLYLLCALVFPRSVATTVNTLDSTPAIAFFTGLLGLIFLAPLCFLLLISVVGIILIPFVVAATLAAIIIGKISVLCFVGQQIGRQFPRPYLQNPLAAILVGGLIFILLYMIPIIGIILWKVSLVLAFGAALVTLFGSFRKESATTRPPTPVAAAPIPPSDPGKAGDPSVAGAAANFPSTAAATQLPPAQPDPLLFPRAGFWKRFMASVLDMILLAILASFVGPFILLFLVIYHVGMWTWRGTTIGGIVLGLKVVRLDGRPVNFGVALVRSLSSFFSAFVLFLGFFWAGWDREKQSWHDKIAGTCIVKVPAGVSLI